MLGHDAQGLRARLVWQGPGGAVVAGPCLELVASDAPVSITMIENFARVLLHHSPLPPALP
jgi:hypothetical protein